MTKLSIYGENAATFLIFQALATTKGAVRDVFLANLKRFGSGYNSDRCKKNWSVKDGGVWLFPCFGKGDGFGEPDVVILAGDDVIWVEVETSINYKRPGIGDLRKSLRQLWRFHILQEALGEGARRTERGLRILGNTISNDGNPRPAKLAVSGHRVLQQIRRRLQSAGKNGRGHYVLFAIDNPGKTSASKVKSAPYRRVLESETLTLSPEGCEGLPQLPLDRCWFAHWSGDICSKLEDHPASSQNVRMNFDEVYVRIKK